MTKKEKGVVIDTFKLYNLNELADLLQVHKETIRLYLNAGKLKGRKMGKKWFVSGKSVQEYFEGSD